MEKHPLRESLWGRGWQDTVHGWKSVGFIILEAILAPLLGFVVDWWWSIVTVAGGMLCIWIGAIARAPVKQRNEARELVEKQRKPSDSEVIDAIGLLEAETLVLRHNNGEERPYSFAQILLAIADHLTSGVSLSDFESQILKGLSLYDEGGWYFPSASYDDITHLTGILAQNALIERHIAEYQHMEREFVHGATGIYLTPDVHLVKNAEVIFYLLPLGFRVVKQLGQQSIAYTEGEISESP